MHLAICVPLPRKASSTPITSVYRRLDRTRLIFGEAVNSSTQSKWCLHHSPIHCRCTLHSQAALCEGATERAQQPEATFVGPRVDVVCLHVVPLMNRRRSTVSPQLPFPRRVADRIAVCVESHTKLTVARRSCIVGMLLRSKIDRTKSNSFSLMRPAPTDGATCRSHAFSRCLMLLQLLSMCAVL